MLYQNLVCNNYKLRFFREQEASGLLSNLGIKTPFCKIPLLGDILFQQMSNKSHKPLK